MIDIVVLVSLFFLNVLRFQGLTNNGNTCFFNSTLQALSQCHYLSQILSSQIESQKNVVVPAPSPLRRRLRSTRGHEDDDDDDWRSQAVSLLST
jgi:hypothetical protein